MLGLLAALVGASSAFATYIPSVNYQPPKIVLVDQQEMGSTEKGSITKQGSAYVFSNWIGVTKHPNSKPGCDKNTSDNYHCPVAGITKIVAQLGAMDDTLSIDLGSKAAKVRQTLLGGTGGDTLDGGPDTQKIKGEEDDDTLNGGAGPDVIDGGPGFDTCDGGPGKDELTHCEASPVR
jgi:Ca2+-binding RTX toxin-like protein